MSIKVVDLSLGMAGALVARFLGDLGGTVLRLEPAGGDPFEAASRLPAAWRAGMAKAPRPDPLTPDTLRAVLDGADVCILGGEDHPGIDRGPAAETLADAFPGLVILEIAGYLSDGPHAGRPAVELLVQARSGLVYEHEPDRPIAWSFPAAAYGAALQGLVAVGAALCERAVSGQGQAVRTSLHQGALTWAAHFWFTSDRTDRAFDFIMPKGARALIFQCADGSHLHFTMGTAGAKGHVYRILGIDDPTLAEDSRGLPSMARGVRNFYGDIELLQAGVGKWRRDDLLNALWAAGLPAEAVNPPGSAWDDPQVVVNGTIVADAAGGRRVGLPLRSTPRLSAGSGAATGGEAAAVLAGVRVIDFGSFTAGPHASMVLADLGADVIKVEPLSADPFRAFYRPFTTSNRGKRAVAIDMKQPEGAAIALRLVETAQMVHHNFRPGVAERLGIGETDLRARNPTVIVLENSGYGADGPKATRAGLDMVFQAFCGHELRAGGAGGMPVGFRSTTIDFAAGLIGAVASLFARYRQVVSQEGSHLDTSLLDTGLFLLSELVQNPDGSFAAIPELNAERTGFHPAEQLYRTGDGWIAIAAPSEAMAQALAGALALDLGPREHWREAASGRIAEAIAKWSTPEAMAALERAGVWAEPCVADAEALFFRDESMRRAGACIGAEDPTYGAVRQIGALFTLSRSSTEPKGNSPRHGEHTREVLGEAGYGAAEIDDFFARRIVG